MGAAVRERLLRATIDVVSTVGYEDTRVDQIVQASGLSRTAFYRHFGGKRGAVLAAGRWVLDDLVCAARTALAVGDQARETGSGRGDLAADQTRLPSPGHGPGGPSPDRWTVGLAALARALSADLPATAVLVLELPAIGTDAASLRRELLALIDGILGRPPALAAWSPAGAVLEVLHRRIADGHTRDLPTLVPDLLAVLTTLVPSTAPPAHRPIVA